MVDCIGKAEEVVPFYDQEEREEISADKLMAFGVYVNNEFSHQNLKVLLRRKGVGCSFETQLKLFHECLLCWSVKQRAFIEIKIVKSTDYVISMIHMTWQRNPTFN